MRILKSTQNSVECVIWAFESCFRYLILSVREICWGLTLKYWKWYDLKIWKHHSSYTQILLNCVSSNPKFLEQMLLRSQFETFFIRHTYKLFLMLIVKVLNLEYAIIIMVNFVVICNCNYKGKGSNSCNILSLFQINKN